MTGQAKKENLMILFQQTSDFRIHVAGVALHIFGTAKPLQVALRPRNLIDKLAAGKGAGANVSAFFDKLAHKEEGGSARGAFRTVGVIRIPALKP